MAEISRANLFGKLNPLMFKAAEGAVTFCKLRGNPNVELAHWLFQIVNLPDSDLHRILRHFEVDSARLVSDLQASLERLPARRLRHRGLLRARALRREGRLDVRDAPVRRLAGPERVPAGGAGQERAPPRRPPAHLAGVPQDQGRDAHGRLRADREGLARGRPGGERRFRGGNAGEASSAIPPAAMGKQEALRRFASDLTARARAGAIDPVTGRDEEIRQVIDILMRRRQNNPLLAGEAGVGKTAVARALRSGSPRATCRRC